MTMTVYFEYHPVGQGLFYSGRLGKFRFVYDCGAGTSYKTPAPDASAAIADYTAGWDDRPLDMLVLSHLHSDHMNGVRQLLKGTHGAKTVVLPYLNPSERLLVAGSQALAGTVFAADDASFLINPVAYLREAGARRIVLIEPGPPNEGTEQPTVEDIAAEPDRRLPAELAGERGAVMRSHLAALITLGWKFKFYCAPNPNSGKLRQALKGAGIDPDKIPASLPGSIDAIRKVYHKLFGARKQNGTSLICYHGPMTPLSKKQGSLSLHHPYSNGARQVLGELTMNPGSCGKGSKPMQDAQVLAGDAEIDLPAYRQHFSAELQEVRSFCLSHHGADANWDVDLLNAHPMCPFWVCSYGLGNTYGHPGPKAVADVLSGGRVLMECNQAQGLAFRGQM